jgi:hypothetical protein
VATPKAPRERVALTHPTGKFSVLVSANRAAQLIGRGYKPHAAGTTTTAGTPVSIPNRNELTIRAKAAGVPVKGTNADLLAAIVAAEQG